MSKYNNIKTEIDGITFDSRKEAARYQELKLLQRCGKISDLRLQVKFLLAPKSDTERAVNYIADFTYTMGDENIVEDVKGYKTKEYIIKRKWFKSKYPSFTFIET